MTTLRDAARRRLELNPITTSLAVSHQGHLQTPSSALSSSSLSAPFGYNPATFTPVSAVRQYNPQQWTSSPSVASGDAGHYQPGNRQDSEVVVVTPAPPPYSPPRSQRTSTIATEEPSSGVSPATRAVPPQAYRSSPEPASNPVFPPPPTTRTRAGSSDRPSSIFNISSFARRPAPEPPRQSTDAIRENVLNARRPVPIAVDPTPTSEDEVPQPVESRPPASRRAVSAGAVSTPSSSRSRGSSSTRWEPGMPLPPPPPGPPPTSRSQSMTRTTDRIVSPLSRRLAPVSSLGPVPPTPAGWVDEDISGRGRSPNRGLHIDTSSISSHSVTESNSGSSASGSALARNHAVRGEPKSIRERRTESKSRKSAAPSDEPSNNPWAEAITPADIVVPPTTLGRRPTITRSTPRSGRTFAETPKSASDSLRTTPVQNGPATGSRGSTPRPLASASRPEAPTPPFSPGQLKNTFIDGSPPIPPKALPTPPPQSRLSLGSPARPISHILHTPNNDSTAIAPLVPSRPGSRQSNTGQNAQISTAEQFARAAIERHKAFAQKEAMAKTDSERVRIFADFIVNESRLRRDRYASAIDEMGSEILELTRDLFRPYKTSRRESNVSRSSGWTPESSSGPQSPTFPAMRSHRGSIMAALNTQLPPSEPTSGSGPVSPIQGRPESTWWTGYMPSLSPIPSMSVSEAPDGSDSRGRPSSRWWELSDGSNGTPSTRLERSKRESKYMGMPKELREALQYESGDAPSGTREMAIAGPSNERGYGENEYPPEKVGWHEESNMSLTPSPQHNSTTSPPLSPPLLTPNQSQLDISRLVTLPPPYPRHHPAVNNNHPDLTSIRTLVRVLSDFTEVEATKSRFKSTSTAIQESLKTEATNRRNSLRANIQRSIEAGNMSYAEAAVVEAEAQAVAQEKEKEGVKADFEMFQSNVIIPLNDLLMDRISRVTELFEQLRSKLFVDAQEQSPNITQEEGDEQPELLEKLTLLKWIFEAREQMHRELYDLLSDRNDRYKEMVITPYRLSNNTTKLINAETFFSEDATKRALAFEQEVLGRTEEFMDIIETNVVRGVEVQLSAFWDIAPSLSLLLQKIPTSPSELSTFQIQIPAQEYEENPSYYDFPLQYLESLLGHCEKSTYQFIESQVNLLCLLHEVKGGVTKVNCRLMGVQRVSQGEQKLEVEKELKAVEEEEERRLTDDLKEKVRCVEEELWGSALGDEIKAVRGSVKSWLIERGGWVEDE